MVLFGQLLDAHGMRSLRLFSLPAPILAGLVCGFLVVIGWSIPAWRICVLREDLRTRRRGRSKVGLSEWWRALRRCRAWAVTSAVFTVSLLAAIVVPPHYFKLKVGVYLFAFGAPLVTLPSEIGNVLRRRRLGAARVRRAMGQCPRCGYDARASVGYCPECGFPVSVPQSPSLDTIPAGQRITTNPKKG